MNSILLVVYDRECRSFLRRVIKPENPNLVQLELFSSN